MKKIFLTSLIIALCAFAQTSFAIPPNYIVTTSSGASIVPGTTDTGNHCDDCTTTIALPFVFTFYDQSFTSANVSSNGELEFTSNDQACCGLCIPSGVLDNSIAALGSDLHTDGTNGEGSPDGIFTSVSGTAPHRIFNIEWITFYHFNTSTTAHFEIRLYEGEQRFDIVYATISATRLGGVGVQRDTGSEFTTVSCDNGPAAGTQYTFRPAQCVTPPADMVGWWPGDNNTLELINGDNGTWQNGSPSYGPGEVSGAFQFGGGGQFVDTNSSVANFGTSDFTIDFWMETSAGGEEVVNKRPVCNLSDTVDSFEVRVSAGGQITFELLRSGDDTNSTLNSVGSFNDGAFHHVAVQRSGNTMSIYVDGVLDNSLTDSVVGATNVNNSAPFAIGGAGCSQAGGDGTATFAGLIDEVEIFNRALSAGEIAAIHDAGGAGKCKPQGLYAADGNGGNPSCHLFLLDPNNGSVIRDIGPIGVGITGLAFDPGTGVLYGVSGGSASPAESLFIIDPVTGAATLVGAENCGPVADITFTSDGTLYGWDECSDDLYTINKSTGAVTKVGEASLSTAGSGISANSGNVLFFGGDRPPSGGLRTVDRATGALSAKIATWSGLPLPGRLNAFAFDPNDVLYAANGGDCGDPTCASHLVTINTTTAAATDKGPSLAGLDAIAFGPAHLCDSNPPTITAASGITRQQGGASSNSQIATVSDTEDPPGSLKVTINGSTSATVNGVTVSNLVVDAAGHVTADVVASCSASNASFTLRVTDSCDNYTEATLTINVTTNNSAIITVPQNIDVIAQKKKVNGQHGAYVFFNVSAVDPEDGPVPATANPPSGSFFPVGQTVVTVTATDHCGNTSTAYFAVDVAIKKKRHAPL